MYGSRHENNLSLCMHDGLAPCSAECPFGLDMRSFVERLQRGRVDAAYRIYRNAVVFPDIVWRVCPAQCQAACERREMDGAVSLKLLEQACVEFTRSTEPIAFNVPQKEQRIAIVGAGLSGMTCALKFAPKKYDVTIFEKTGAIGGGLSAYMPEEVYLNEFTRQFGNEKYTLHLNTPVEDLLSLQYDAVYVSSGVELPGEGLHIFRCPPDLAPVHMIADGIGSLHEIEWYLKTGRRRQPGEILGETKWHPGEAVAEGTPIVVLDKKKLNHMPVIAPANGESYTKEEAIDEAKRCVLCDCTACLDYCALLRKYRMYPPRLKEEVELTMNPVTLLTGREALRQISSCSQCGVCKQVCPVGVDVGDYFLRTRRELHDAGAFPPAFHDFWLRDMAFANGEARLLVNPAGTGAASGAGAVAGSGAVVGSGAVAQVFFPGCQIGGSDPRYVSQTYARLLEAAPDTALLLRCCGAPAIWAGDSGLHQGELAAIRETWQALGKPVFLLACPSCQKMFKDYLPEIECRMIYGVLLAHVDTRQMEGRGEASVFDPCASRYDEGTQQAVRQLATAYGYTLEELPYGKDEARCCSWGAQSFTADPVLAKTDAQSWAAWNDTPYITYCTNCRDIFTREGKPCMHILDLVLGINSESREAPTATMRRHNRVALKQGLTEIYGGQIMDMGDAGRDDGDGEAIKLLISDELSRAMSEALILEEEIREVIRYCESSGKKMMNRSTGHFAGHLKQGIITYWAEYAPAEEDGTYHLINAYSHRLVMEE